MPGTHASILHEDRFFDPDPAVRRDRARAVRGDAGPADRQPARPRGSADPRRRLAVPGTHRADRPAGPLHPADAVLPRRPDGAARHRPEGRWRRRTGIRAGIWKRSRRALPPLPGHADRRVARLRAGSTSSACARVSTLDRRPEIYDEIAERARRRPSSGPRALFERFHIEVLATTEPRRAIRWPRTQRLRDVRLAGQRDSHLPPGRAIDLASAGWKAEIDALGDVHQCPDPGLRVAHARADQGAVPFFRSDGRHGNRPRRRGARNRATPLCRGGASCFNARWRGRT